MDLFMMTGSSWAWFDAPVMEQADKELDGSKFQTFQIKWENFRTTPTGLNSVNAIGLNLYGTQVSGTITVDYIKGIKADGTSEIIDDFDSKPSTEGTASGKIVAIGGTSAITAKPVVAASKMLVNVQPGLVNTKGEVIAQQSFSTSKGATAVELRSTYRGVAMLIVRQGSQQLVQKVILK